jgi:hypothetical protein
MITDFYLNSQSVKLDTKSRHRLMSDFVLVLICLIHCYKKDLRAFQSSWSPNFSHSCFRTWHYPAFNARSDRTLISGPEFLSDGLFGFRQKPILQKLDLVYFVRGLQSLTKTCSRRLSWRSSGASTRSRSLLLRLDLRNISNIFFDNIMNPIMRCLVHHCDDRDSVFIEQWHKIYTPHSFRERCCPRNCPKQAGPLPQ